MRFILCYVKMLLRSCWLNLTFIAFLECHNYYHQKPGPAADTTS